MKITLLNDIGTVLAVKEVDKDNVTTSDIPDSWELCAGDIIKVEN